jgi:hypothetical protein
MKSLLVVFAVAAPLSFAAHLQPASAAPFGAASALAQTSATEALQPVHWRRYRHCHGSRYGRRWCHGGYRPQRCVRAPVRVCREGRGCRTRFEMRCRRW